MSIRRGVIGAIAASLIALSTPAFAEGGAALRTLTAGGEAEIAAPPDLAVVRLGATVQDADAAAAQRRVNEVMSAAVDAIIRTGVVERDVQTAQLTLHPVYADHASRPRGSEPAPAPRIVGYRATNTVQVSVRELSKVGAAIDAGVGAGANQLQGIEFRLEDDEAQRLAALRAATEQAQRKAKAIAAAADVALGVLHSIHEGGQNVVQPQFELRQMAMADSGGAPILPGQVRVRASVTLVYRLAEPR